MKIRLLAAGTRMPSWVDSGVRHYTARLPRHWSFEVREVPLGRRGKSVAVETAVRDEGQRMLSALRDDEQVVCLDIGGKPLDTPAVAALLETWAADGRDVALLVGGPDGLAPACLARATLRWSLSPLTLPHGLVRIVVTEALFRAASIHANHPYHR